MHTAVNVIHSFVRGDLSVVHVFYILCCDLLQLGSLFLGDGLCACTEWVYAVICFHILPFFDSWLQSLIINIVHECVNEMNCSVHLVIEQKILDVCVTFNIIVWTSCTQSLSLCECTARLIRFESICDVGNMLLQLLLF